MSEMRGIEQLRVGCKYELSLQSRLNPNTATTQVVLEAYDAHTLTIRVLTGRAKGQTNTVARRGVYFERVLTPLV